MFTHTVLATNTQNMNEHDPMYKYMWTCEEGASVHTCVGSVHMSGVERGGKESGWDGTRTVTHSQGVHCWTGVIDHGGTSRDKSTSSSCTKRQQKQYS